MTETGKTLTALLVLALAGVGAYSSGKWVLDTVRAIGERPEPVAKKRAPVKPETLVTESADATWEEEPRHEERFTFFETLGDSSMTKIAGLEGRILSKEDVALKEASPGPARKQAARAAPVRSRPAVADVPAHAEAEPPKRPEVKTALGPEEEFALALPGRRSPREDTDEAGPLYAVQVSSFRDSDRARHLEEKLKEMGYEAFQLAAGSASEVHHRVYLGKYADRQSADMAARKVRMQEALGGMVITLGR
jgi:cell division septation protein DedD